MLLALALLVTILCMGKNLSATRCIADKDDVGNGEGHSLMSVGRLVRVRRLFQSLGPVHFFVLFHVDDLTLSLHQLEKSRFRLATSWLRTHPTATDAARNDEKAVRSVFAEKRVKNGATPLRCCVKTVSERYLLEPLGLTVERRADSPDLVIARSSRKRWSPWSPYSPLGAPELLSTSRACSRLDSRTHRAQKCRMFSL